MVTTESANESSFLFPFRVMAFIDSFNSVIARLFVASLLLGVSRGEDDVPTTTETPIVGVFMPLTMIPPKITLVSHTLIGDTIDIPSESTIHLRCTGQRPMVWIFPHNHPNWVEYNSHYDNLTVTSNCDRTTSQIDFSPSRCWTEAIIHVAKFDMTGSYVCQYNMSNSKSGNSSAQFFNYHPISENVLSAPFSDHVIPSMAPHMMDTIYIFVNDIYNLMVPFEGQTEFFFIALFQHHPATIPCRPTFSKATVRLLKMQTKEGEAPQEIKPNATLGISYNPKKGFYFELARWDSDSNLLQCHYEMDGISSTTAVNIHWSFLPSDIHPMIDDTNARQILENQTFTLRCFVHIDIGVIIVIHWIYPNKNAASKRITQSRIDTQRINVNGNSYDTVSVNLTVANATTADEGEYRCNAVDGNNRIFYTTKRIIILDKYLPPAINFTTELNTSLPFVRDAGEDFRFVTLVNAYPDISLFNLTWYKDGEELQLNTSHYQIETFSDMITQISFFIPSTVSSDSGEYVLVGNSSTASANISFTMYISGEPELVLENEHKFYTLNQSYEISCKSYSYPVGETWWSWLPCDPLSPASCLNASSEGQYYSDNDTRWIPLPFDAILTSNKVIVHLTKTQLHQQHYLNESVLQIGAAHQAGVYRCSAQNKYKTVQHYQMPFLVMDSEETFSVTSSTDEPTINDTIVITCKASIIEYEQVHWVTVPNQLSHKSETTTSNNTFSLSSSILLRLVQINDSSIFECAATRRSGESERKHIYLTVKNVSSPSFVDTNLDNEIIEKEYNSQFELRCYINGRPTPALSWYRDDREIITKQDSGIRTEDRGQRLIFSRLLGKDAGTYECRAGNRAGSIARRTLLKVKGTDGFEDTIQISEIIVIIFLSLIAFTMLLMALCIGKRSREAKLAKRDLEFFSSKIFENGQMELFNPEMPLDEQIDLLPYDSRFEFPKERLRLGRTLGQGAFGRVVKAEAIGLENENSSTTVAVKMLKERADTNQRKALMAELKILIHLGRHLNIVNLLGAVTKNIVKGELLVIVEYCEFGNLRHFLLSNRETFINELEPGFDEGQLDYQNVDFSHVNSDMQSVPSTPSSPTTPHSPVLINDYINTNGNGLAGGGGRVSQLAYYNHNYVSGVNSFTTSFTFRKQRSQRRVCTSDLICFAFQCARGMEYLTSRKLIHRDLAARNVLLASNNVVKICDFGLAKDVYKYDNYVKKDNGPLPIKWMAIESISDKIFTSKSDVWSFAILLWEIFTLGKNPYPGIEIDEEFYKRLKAGYRMEKPEFASDRIYGLMSKCWAASPNERPDFGEIVTIIGDLMDDKVRQHYIDLNNPYSEMNQQIFSNLPEDYLKMTSMTSGYAEDYLKMNDDSANGGFVVMQQQTVQMMDEQNNNSAAVASAKGDPPAPSGTLTIPAEHGPVEMISMQNLNHCSLPEEDEEREEGLEVSPDLTMHYDNLDQVVVKHREVQSNGSLKHSCTQINHHYVSQPIQQTIL